MLKGQTTIGKVVARCPAGTERAAARLRLAHLLGGADLAPRGFPPGAILVIRKARAERGLALDARAPRAAWEREMRERVSALWRRAARPEGGRVPLWAEAALFADEGEWLAALALAAARGELGSHWCWRDSRWSGAPAQALVRAWGESPRFVPAAVVRLARWGEAARALGVLGPTEASAVLGALRSEFGLPRASSAHAARATQAETRPAATSEPVTGERRRPKGVVGRPAETSSVGVGGTGGGPHEDGTSGVAFGSERAAPPWARWLPPDGGACVRLHAPARSLLSYAAALFHEPARARGRDFAEEVFAFNEEFDARAPETTGRARGGRSRQPHAYDRAVGADARPRVFDERHRAGPDSSAPPDAPRGGPRASPPDEDAAARPTRGEANAGMVGEPETDGPGRSSEGGATRRARSAPDPGAAAEEACAVETLADPWGELGGCETRLGGALFLLNLLAGLRLPECFDEDYGLSEQITGWGLTELLARSLLGEACAEFEDDPLWCALAGLDGRAAGEPPARDLRVGTSYRAPARWLRLFAPRAGDEVWLAGEDEGRLVLTHPAGFPVAVLPLEGQAPAALAALVAGEYVAQGVSASPRAAAHVRSAAAHSSEGLRVHGGARPGEELRRWMSWTFPFLKYALRRSLAEGGEEPEGDGAAREMIERRGRLYCTTTHVDLVLEMSRLSFAARRAGLDASPGWVRDLMRVVAFHYE